MTKMDKAKFLVIAILLLVGIAPMSAKENHIKNGATINAPSNALPTFEDLTGKSTPLRRNDGHPCREALDKLELLCKRDFWKFFGKESLSDLDKELYKKTPEFSADFNRYHKELDGTYYFIGGISKNDSKFTTSKAVFRTYADILIVGDRLPVLNLLYLGKFYCPFNKKNVVKDYPYPYFTFTINTSDLKFLKKLQTYNNDDELALLYIVKPGIEVVSSPYGNTDILVKPVSLYLFNNVSNEIICDLSNCLNKDPNSLIPTYRRIVAERRAHDGANSSDYHQQAIKKTCSWCMGTGYVSGYMSQRQICSQCHGKGYEYTHYY